jgi:sulfhydrogenase subunit alpha
MQKNTINIPILARVEGEGALELAIDQQQIQQLKLRIYEPPRLFEKFLEQRSYQDVLDFVARICGICPVAYQMSAVNALESLFAFTPSEWVQNMRRVFYCGEWVQSHSLHIHLLAAPDFLGFEHTIAMAKDYPEEVKRGLRLQQLGNELISLLGKRSVHPIGACVGGFFSAPEPASVAALLPRLETGVKEAADLVRWVASLDLPQQQQFFPCVALQETQRYAINHGNIVSNQGLNIPPSEFDQHFTEFQAAHSTALHCSLHQQAYLVGPLARLNLNHPQLPSASQQLINEIQLNLPSYNMFHSIIARALEIHYALSEALRILANYEYTQQYKLPVQIKAGTGYGCTEAPRGMLWQCYQVDAQGIIRSSRIVPPTSQNQARIEQDLKTALEHFGLDQPNNALRAHSEMVIRNYDPCISCSTHFLDLRVTRQ